MSQLTLQTIGSNSINNSITKPPKFPYMKSKLSFKHKKSSLSTLNSSKNETLNNSYANVNENVNIKFSEMKTDLVSILETLSKEFVRLKQDLTEQIQNQELDINDAFGEVEKQLEETNKIQNDLLLREKARISGEAKKNRLQIRKSILDYSNKKDDHDDVAVNQSIDKETIDIPKRKFSISRVQPMVKEKKMQVIPSFLDELIEANTELIDREDKIIKNREGGL